MAQLPQSRKLLVEDFPKQTWIEPLLSSVNQFMEDVTDALDHNLTLEDNLDAKLLEVELDGTFPLKLSWSGSRPRSVLVGNCYRSDGTAFTLSAAVQVQWQYNAAGQLQIDAVVGITPSGTTKYKLILECKAG